MTNRFVVVDVLFEWEGFPAGSTSRRSKYDGVSISRLSEVFPLLRVCKENTRLRVLLCSKWNTALRETVPCGKGGPVQSSWRTSVGCTNAVPERWRGRAPQLVQGLPAR